MNNSIGIRRYLGRLTLAVLFLASWFPASRAEQFSIVAMPDTQAYLDHGGDTINGGNASIFFAQTQWIANNIGAEDIIYVTHLGDIVNQGDCDPADEHWATANDAMATLDGTGIPYGIAPGNHDYDFSANNSCEADEPTIKYNDGTLGRPGFGADRYAFPEYGPQADQYDTALSGADNDNNFILFESPGGVEFIALNLAWSNSSTTVDPNLGAGEAATIAAEETAVLAWADATLKAYPNRKAIVTSHEISGDRQAGSPCDAGPAAGGSGVNFSPFGAAIYDALKGNPNLYMMLSGHCDGENYFRMSGDAVPATDGAQDDARLCMNDVHVIMSNYQFGSVSIGPLRLMKFDTIANTVDIETISATGGAGPNNFSTATMSTSTRTNFTIPYENEISPSGVVLLSDTSGSMNWGVDGNTSPAAGEARIDFARQAADTFVDLMWGAPSSQSVLNIGLAEFPDHPFSSGIASANTIIPLSLFDNTVRTNLINSIGDDITSDLNPGGGTPMLEGLREADGMLNAMQCKVVVLLSDGRHNVPNTVTPGDAEVTNLINVDLEGASDTPTQVYAINFAEPGEGDEALLQAIADGTDPDSTAGNSSQYFDATVDISGTSFNTGLGLTTRYQKIITRLLGLEFGIDPIDSIGLGETNSFFQSVNLHDRKVSFVVSWRPSDNPLSVTVYDSSGQVVTPKDPGVSLIQRDSYLIFGVGREALTGVGRVGSSPWRVDVHSRIRIVDCPPTRVCDDVIIDDNGREQFYQYSSILDSALKLKTRLGRDNYWVGDRIRMTAEVIEGRRSIKGLKEIEVLVAGPGDGLGNFFAANKVDPGDLEKIPAHRGGEILSPIFRKALFLKEIAGLQFPARLAQQRIQMYDDGSNGDEIAGDGIYTALFANTGKEGLYSFYFRAAGDTRHGNRFNREDLIERHLKVRPVAAAIDILAVAINSNDFKIFNLSVVPKDLLGNFAGPGQTGGIKLFSNEGKFEGVILDNLDGSYTQTLVLDPNTREDDVNIAIDVLGAKKVVNLGEVLSGGDPEPKRCDIDGNGGVDIYDIRAIVLKRNQPASGPDDPMDWDRNGIINLLDVRGCQISCTLPRCAPVAQP